MMSTHSCRILPLSLLLLIGFLHPITSKLITISNDVPRVDTDGNIVDCHSGMILPVNNTFYMYGEHYGNTTGFGPSPPAIYPKIVVYTSPDLMSWTFKGFALHDWPTKPYGTFFTPWTIYNKETNTFVMWFNAYLQGCCTGGWGVATSSDGLNFTVTTLNATGKYAVVDCNALFVDDDGKAYNLYSSEDQDHRESIELLTGDYTAIAGDNLGLFPDHYTEGGVLFKRNGIYYVGYSSCCCFCRAGSGWVVYSSPSLLGPWTRQPYDLNCASNVTNDICGGYGERDGDPIIVTAQGIGLSLIPLADGSTAYLWHGERWLSAADNNPSCPDECRPGTGECAEPPTYIKGNGFSYWIPLQFSSNGTISPLGAFTNNFTLDIAENFGTSHLPGRAQVKKEEEGDTLLFTSS